MPSYTITEPHPTLHSLRPRRPRQLLPRPGDHLPFGRAHPLTPTTTTSSSSSTRRFYSGRGGAGNAHKVTERPVMSFAEEFARAEVREKTAIISHVGRGGAGNIFSSEGKKIKKEEGNGADLSRRDTSSTTSSGRSSSSTLGGLWGRVRSVGH
ncbi:hypothetical protein N0V88_002446 [Collariella sp. IMI 366227]|nr:hypothetical protein N0V88_002446 [Collariella sp. IMI 366227]